MPSASRANTSTVPDVISKLTSIGFRRSNVPKQPSEMLLTVESSAFSDMVLSALKYRDSDVAVLAVSVTRPDAPSAFRWSAFMVASTKQMFLTPQSGLPLCKVSLVAMLDMAEQLGASEAFVCLRRGTPESSVLAVEFSSMGFKNLSPRQQPFDEFVVLRFDF